MSYRGYRPIRRGSWRSSNQQSSSNTQRRRNRHNRWIDTDYQSSIEFNPKDPLNIDSRPLRSLPETRNADIHSIRQQKLTSCEVIRNSSSSESTRNPSQPSPIEDHSPVVRHRSNSKYLNARKRRSQKLHKTGNYTNYYTRRPVDDRFNYLLPEWFSGKDVADYGCNNGQFSLALLRCFPDVKSIDAYDCDPDLIANAKCLQQETLRWNSERNVPYEKVKFLVADWAVDGSWVSREIEYDTIIAFSVTKWIHLQHGDAGLLRFFRRALASLKPGGRLILEPQPKSSYKKSVQTAKHRENFEEMKIDPSNFDHILLNIGFSYFDVIRDFRLPGEPFNRQILLCQRSYGVTPSSVRNRCRQQVFESPILASSQSPSLDLLNTPIPVYGHYPPPLSVQHATPSRYVHSSHFSPQSQPLTPASVQNQASGGGLHSVGWSPLSSSVPSPMRRGTDNTPVTVWNSEDTFLGGSLVSTTSEPNLTSLVGGNSDSVNATRLYPSTTPEAEPDSTTSPGNA